MGFDLGPRNGEAGDCDNVQGLPAAGNGLAVLDIPHLEDQGFKFGVDLRGAFARRASGAPAVEESDILLKGLCSQVPSFLDPQSRPLRSARKKVSVHPSYKGKNHVKLFPAPLLSLGCWVIIIIRRNPMSTKMLHPP